MKGSNSFAVLDICVSLFVNPVKGKVFSVYLIPAVTGFIVDDHDFVISIILGENRVKVVFDSEVCVIVVSWHHDTHWNLGFDFIEAKFSIQALPFLHIHTHAVIFVLFIQSIVVFGEVDLREARFGVKEAYALLLKLLTFLLLLGIIEHLIDPKINIKDTFFLHYFFSGSRWVREGMRLRCILHRSLRLDYQYLRVLPLHPY